MSNIDKKYANLVWDLLIKEGIAREDERSVWLYVLLGRDNSEEYRLGGKLGFGGKAYITAGKWYLGCYVEDRTPEREAIIEKINGELLQLKEQYDGETAETVHADSRSGREVDS